LQEDLDLSVKVCRIILPLIHGRQKIQLLEAVDPIGLDIWVNAWATAIQPETPSFLGGPAESANRPRATGIVH